MEMKVNARNDVQWMVDYLRRRYNAQGEGYRWIGNPEGSPASTKYPNLVAESVFSRIWLDTLAGVANVSMEVMTAVAEDDEELSYAEMERVVKYLNATQSSRYLMSLEYLASPVLSYLDSGSNKGRWRLRQLESLYEAAGHIEKSFRLLPDLLDEQTRGLIADMKAGKTVLYAEYHAAAGVLDCAIEEYRNACYKRNCKRTKRMRELLPMSDYEKRMCGLMRLLHDKIARKAFLTAMETLIAGGDTSTALAAGNRILTDAGRAPLDYDKLMEAIRAANASAAEGVELCE